MNKYYEIKTYSTFLLINPKFSGEHVEADTYYDILSSDRISLGNNGAWYIKPITSIKEISEKELNKLTKQKITVKLNDSYSAEITKENVKLNCQEFSHEAIKNLAKELENFLTNN